MMGAINLILAQMYCCDLALLSGCQRHSYECPMPPHKHRRWKPAPPPVDDGGQGEGCEGGKCAIRERG